MKEKIETAQLLGNVRVKLRTYGLRGYEPPEGLRVEVRLSLDLRAASFLTDDESRSPWICSLQDVAARWEDLILAEVEQARLVDSCMTRCVGLEVSL